MCCSATTRRPRLLNALASLLTCLLINHLGSDAEAAAVANLISGGALPNLTHLNLGSNGIGPAGVGALADAISQGGAPNLVEISLADNLGLGEGSTVALVEAVATRGGRLIL